MSVKDVIVLGCSSQQHTRDRNHGAYLVRWNEEGLLFDPGEGTQRQFIFADIAPPTVTRIFISHFHGDHCLGLGSMLLRLNLDKVKHPIHCYYPKSGKKYFDRLRYCCIYHENITVIEHQVEEDGIVHEDETFTIEAKFLTHGVETVGWRVQEKDKIKFDKRKLDSFGITGKNVKKLEKDKSLKIKDQTILLEDVSWVKKGDSVVVALDTKPCNALLELAHEATVFLVESTYLDSEKKLAAKYMHMTAKQAAEIALKCDAKMLILTHFSARYKNLSLFEKEAKEIFPNTHIAKDFKKIHFPK